jgi:orotidine-5'-phosphate decarboxylase
MSQVFLDKLRDAWATRRSMLCVGLDPDPKRFPAPWTNRIEGVAEFCEAIVDATADLVCAYKPQIAYFSALGAEDQLEAVIAHIRDVAPHACVILDAKRGDIGSTALLYSFEAFGRYGADAVTVNPYLGLDTLEEFDAWTEQGMFVLCRTSNPGSGDFQDLDVGGEPLYVRVARRVTATYPTAGLVVGATYPEEVAVVRAAAPDAPLLVPGIGAQGGDLEATVRNGATAAGGLVLNSSRAVLYASGGADFDDAARREAIRTRDAIEAARP